MTPQELVTHQAGDKPPLVIVQREGDPRVALAVAAWLPGGPTALRSVATTLDVSLRSAGYTPYGRVGADSIVVAFELASADGAPKALAAIRRGLLSARLRTAPPAPVQADPCAPTADDRSAEQLRAALGQSNVALSVVGPELAVEQVATAYEGAEPWPEGRSGEDVWPAADVYATARQVRGQRLQVALRVDDEARALGAARTLASPSSSLGWVAKVAPPSWELDRVTASLRPSGACLLAEVSTPRDGSVRSAARLARAVRAELARQFASAERISPELLPLEAPRGVDAASRAAWAALTSRHDPGAVRAHVFWSASDADSATFEREARAARGPQLDLRHALERGQGRVWALLSSACPTAHEDALSAGHTATALTAAARFARQDEPTATVRPWMGPHGLGLAASLPAHEGGAAVRLAEVLGRALLAAASDAKLVADARAFLLDGREPSPAWELALRLGSDGHPSHLLPRGLSTAGDTFDVDTSRAALRGFVAGRLRLAVLANHDATQAEQLSRRLSELLQPLGPSSNECPKPPKPPRTSGEYLLDTKTTQALLVYPLAADQLEGASTAAALLSVPGGWLQRTVLDAGLSRHAEAYAFGVPNQRAALIVALSDEPERLGPAVMQVRALVDRLRSTRVSAASLVQARAVRAARQDLADPAERLAQLSNPPETPLTPQQMERFFSRELAEERLIVVRPVPPSPPDP